MIAEKEDSSGLSHASLLTLFIQQLFTESQLTLKDLDAVAVSSGPGSYTGLRIGAVTAKGLCYTLQKPLLALDSLQCLAAGMEKKYQSDDVLFCPTIDARRNEIYYGLYGKGSTELVSSTNCILTENIPFTVADGKIFLVGGSGANKCGNYWRSPSLKFDDKICFTAQDMITLAENKFRLGRFENVISFEPTYLKPVYFPS